MRRNSFNDSDPRYLPAYSFTEAAHYLGIPMSTLRSWFLGQSYKDGSTFKSVIAICDKKHNQLSFINLVEAHVLDAIRREHRIPLPKVRKALDYLRSEFNSKHPLIEENFATDGVSLFVEKMGTLLNITHEGQYAMRQVLQAYLKRIDRDVTGAPIKLYLYIRKRDLNEPRVIEVNPRVSFGRPVLAGTGIATSVIAERYKAGETMESLAKDYGRSNTEIQEAIRCELQAA